MAATSRAARGTVRAFDDEAGLGEVVADDGVTYLVHCTAIADGSRTIAAGTAVRFSVVAGRQGRWEATDVEPV
ncbi:MAG: cold shock domain-containing protein [Acidimicrobiales bacterium]